MASLKTYAPKPINYTARRVRRLEIPIKGQPEHVIDELQNLILKASMNDHVREFYIGRTNDLEARQADHGCDEIFALYETDSADHAIKVEDELINAFIDDLKCSNESSHGGGGVSDEYVNYVYLACWY